MLDPAKVPTPLHKLIPLAEEWGINDDYSREKKLTEATNDELRALISSIDEISDDDLYDWLEGEESFSDMPSEEYVTFTCFTMAIDSARVRLRKRNRYR